MAKKKSSNRKAGRKKKGKGKNDAKGSSAPAAEKNTNRRSSGDSKTDDLSERGSVIALKLSPNLRKDWKESGGGITLSQSQVASEVARLDHVLEHVEK